MPKSHVFHLHENYELSFGDIKSIFTQAATGKLEGTVKIDGQNLFLSYSAKRGTVVAARNKADIKFGGSTKEEFAQKYREKEGIAAAFVDAMTSFEKTVRKFTKSQQIEIFGPDADIYFNCEVVDPRNPNVIKYDIPSVSVHRTGQAKFNRQSGEAESVDVSENAQKLSDALNLYGGKPDAASFEVKMDAIKTLKGLSDKTALSAALNSIDALQKQYKLTDGDTIGDAVFAYLHQKLPQQLKGCPDYTLKLLVKRVVGIKGYTSAQVLSTVTDPELKTRIGVILDNSDRVLSDAIEPIEIIIHDFAVEMLKSLESIFILDPQTEIKRIRAQVSTAIENIQSSGIEEAMKVLQDQLKKLKSAENVSSASEGFVFVFKGKPYKFTGNFAPVNQLLGMFKYGRGKMPPLSSEGGLNIKLASDTGTSKTLKETVERGGRTIAVVPGSFKPPHRGHLEMIKHYASISNSVIIILSPLSRSLPTGQEITSEQSKKVWELYLRSCGLFNKVKILDPTTNSPVTEAYKFISNPDNNPYFAKPGDTVIVGVSEKDEDINRFKDIQRYASQKAPKVTVKVDAFSPQKDPNTGKEYSSTDMRAAISSGDLSKFVNFLPKEIQSHAKSVMAIFKSNTVVPATIKETPKKLTSMLESLIKVQLDDIVQKQVILEETVPLEDSLGAEREQMPQIKSDSIAELRTFLKQKGISTTEEDINVSSVQPSQKAIDQDKVDSMIENNCDCLKEPILISNDFFIVDGHHRWAANQSLNPDSIIKTVKVELPIQQAVKEINSFYDTTHAGLENETNT